MSEFHLSPDVGMAESADFGRERRQGSTGALEGYEVLILAGGTDAEREVSMMAAHRLSDAMNELGLRHQVAGLGELLSLLSEGRRIVVFNVLYGPFGEGGAIAGLMDCLDVPCVYSQAGPSAIALDKWRCQLVLEGAGVLTSRGAPFDSDGLLSGAKVAKFPVIVKPLKQGSSVDVSIVSDADALADACAALCRVHGGGLLEDYLPGAEYSVGVLEMPDGTLLALPPIGVTIEGAMIASSAAKYGDGLRLACPASGDPIFLNELQDIAKRAFIAIGCSQVVRVDFRCCGDGTPRVLEINHHPGMTDHSWLPIAASTAGFSYNDLTLILLETAVARIRRSAKLKNTPAHALTKAGSADSTKLWVVEKMGMLPSTTDSSTVVDVETLVCSSRDTRGRVRVVDAIYDGTEDCTELRAAIDALGFDRVGMSILSSALTTDKLLQRHVAKAMKVPQPRYQRLDLAATPGDLELVVLKKRFSNQSRDVHLTYGNSVPTLISEVAATRASDWMLEEYSPGDEVHVIMGMRHGKEFISDLARIPGGPDPWILSEADKLNPDLISLNFDVVGDAKTRISGLCHELYRAFDTPPLCRIEWRIEPSGKVTFIEFDACPGLGIRGLAARILRASFGTPDWLGGGFLC